MAVSHSTLKSGLSFNSGNLDAIFFNSQVMLQYTGRSTAKPDYRRHNYYAQGRGCPGYHIQVASFRLVEKRPHTSSDFQEEEGGEVNVTQISINIEVQVRNSSYIDDSYLLGEKREDCQANISDTFDLFSKLGFILHPVHSVLKPVQVLTFLGFVLNSVDVTVSLTWEKV